MNNETPSLPLVESSDRNFDYLYNRIRECPNCGVCHYARNRARNFCSKRCYDEYYNNFIRNQSASNVLSNGGLIENPVVTHAQPVNENATSPLIGTNERRDRNIRILDSLSIDTENGSAYCIEDLWTKQYDFNVFDKKLYFQTTSAADESNGITIENYQIFRINENRVLITKIN